jgi:hypothetical protein
MQPDKQLPSATATKIYLMLVSIRIIIKYSQNLLRYVVMQPAPVV